MGTWDLDPATNQITGYERLKSWSGLPANSALALSRRTDMIAATDWQRVIDAINTAMSYASGGNYNIEYTIERVGQNSRRVRAKGKALFNDQQQSTRFSGILQDVTAASDEHKDTNERLELTLEQ